MSRNYLFFYIILSCFKIKFREAVHAIGDEDHPVQLPDNWGILEVDEAGELLSAGLDFEDPEVLRTYIQIVRYVGSLLQQVDRLDADDGVALIWVLQTLLCFSFTDISDEMSVKYDEVSPNDLRKLQQRNDIMREEYVKDIVLAFYALVSKRIKAVTEGEGESFVICE